MKKILLSFTIGLLFTSVTLAIGNNPMGKKETHKEKRALRIEKRNMRKNEVADQTIEQFSRDFPTATEVSYERSKWFDEVDFTLQGQQVRAYYDQMCRLVGTTNRESFSDLPEVAQRLIHKHYSDYEVKEVIHFHDNEDNDSDMVFYGTSFEDADNSFVRLSKEGKNIVVKVSPQGDVSYYTQLK